VFRTSAGTPYGQRNVGRAFDGVLERAGIAWTTRCDDCGWSVTAPATAARAAASTHLAADHPGADAKSWTWSTEDKPTLHSLRHTFASAIIAGGADQGHVARLLGHTDPAFTYKVYVHEFDQAQRQAESKAALGAAYAGRALGILVLRWRLARPTRRHRNPLQTNHDLRERLAEMSEFAHQRLLRVAPVSLGSGGHGAFSGVVWFGGCYWTGVSPCRRMTSPSAAKSGGRPAAASRMAATSRK
jgi:Phage integrase family